MTYRNLKCVEINSLLIPSLCAVLWQILFHKKDKENLTPSPKIVYVTVTKCSSTSYLCKRWFLHLNEKLPQPQKISNALNTTRNYKVKLVVIGKSALSLDLSITLCQQFISETKIFVKKKVCLVRQS